ncbi:hypothetical protein [Tepidibacillus marianensis]|uniref:hypothetical protein n=1 Tax=Tepidibacillus marianensis TaxID=3131995 RepID=UPI0030D35D45
MSIHPHVFQEYDFDIQKIENFHSTVKLTTQLGEFALKKTKNQPEQFDRMREVMGHLERHQLLVNPIIPNKFGDLIVPTANGLVYVSKWVEAKHLRLNYQPHFLAAIKAMAKMHQIGLDFEPAGTSYYPSMNEIHLLHTWKQRVIWLKNIRNNCVGIKV